MKDIIRKYTEIILEQDKLSMMMLEMIDNLEEENRKIREERDRYRAKVRELTENKD